MSGTPLRGKFLGFVALQCTKPFLLLNQHSNMESLNVVSSCENALNNCRTLVAFYKSVDNHTFVCIFKTKMRNVNYVSTLLFDSIHKIDKGMQYDINIVTPFMFLDKAEEWKAAETVGGKDFVHFVIKETHTCYNGDHEHFHEWGYGCGVCPACNLRAEGFSKYKRSQNDYSY